LVLAVHNYHDVLGCLPPENPIRRVPMPTATSLPASTANRNPGFYYRLLPFIELQQVFNQFKLSADMTVTSSGGEITNMGLASVSLGASPISAFTCPSAGAEPIRVGLSDAGCYYAHYVGISGAIDGQGSSTPPINSGDLRLIPLDEIQVGPIQSISTSYPYYGVAADNGAIVFGTIKDLGALSDGTSNTFCIGELSWPRLTRLTSGTSHIYRAWTRGGYYGNSPTYCLIQLTSKTIRDHANYSLNYALKTSNLPGSYGFDNVHNAMSPTSMHPGIVHFAFADGSVIAVGDTINPQVLLFYGSGNDEKVLQPLK